MEEGTSLFFNLYEEEKTSFTVKITGEVVKKLSPKYVDFITTFYVEYAGGVGDMGYLYSDMFCTNMVTYSELKSAAKNTIVRVSYADQVFHNPAVIEVIDLYDRGWGRIALVDIIDGTSGFGYYYTAEYGQTETAEE